MEEVVVVTESLEEVEMVEVDGYSVVVVVVRSVEVAVVVVGRFVEVLVVVFEESVEEVVVGETVKTRNGKSLDSFLSGQSEVVVVELVRQPQSMMTRGWNESRVTFQRVVTVHRLHINIFLAPDPLPLFSLDISIQVFFLFFFFVFLLQEYSFLTNGCNEL